MTWTTALVTVTDTTGARHPKIRRRACDLLEQVWSE